MDGAPADDPVTTAPVRTNGSAPAEVRVYGLAGEEVAERLKTDAKLLTCIAGHEDELNAMTMELIETSRPTAGALPAIAIHPLSVEYG